MLKPETVNRLLLEVGDRGCRVVDRWASGWPAKTKKLEAPGTLIDRVKEQAKLENQTLSDARVHEANRSLPDSEILALYDIPIEP